MCRYELEFIEQERLGQGGFGVVVAAINRIDGRRYAVKKIPMTGHDIGSNTLREVSTLSGLHHGHIVRYYQAWREHVDHKIDDSTSVEGSESYLFARHTHSDSVPTAASTAVGISGLGQHMRSTTMWSSDSDAQLDGGKPLGHVHTQSGVLDTVREASQDIGDIASTPSQGHGVPLPPGMLGSVSGTKSGGSAGTSTVGDGHPQHDVFVADETASGHGEEHSNGGVDQRDAAGTQGLDNGPTGQFASVVFHDVSEDDDAAAAESLSTSEEDEAFSDNTNSFGSKSEKGNSAFTFAHSRSQRETVESVATSYPPPKLVCVFTCVLAFVL